MVRIVGTVLLVGSIGPVGSVAGNGSVVSGFVDVLSVTIDPVVLVVVVDVGVVEDGLDGSGEVSTIGTTITVTITVNNPKPTNDLSHVGDFLNCSDKPIFDKLYGT